MSEILHFFLHLDDQLAQLIQQYGPWIYGILFLIIFCETGLVVTPFLPGDSLLFAVGALAADPKTGLNVWFAAILMLVAAIVGDTVNYSIGKFAGEGLARRFPKLIKPKYLAQTHAFFEKYGGKTIILARFVPIVRTFAPFVAGSGAMNYSKFMLFNVTGAVLWVGLITAAGWFFGNIPVVKKNFEFVVLGIIFVSVLPIVFEMGKAWLEKRKTGV